MRFKMIFKVNVAYLTDYKVEYRYLNIQTNKPYFSGLKYDHEQYKTFYVQDVVHI